MGGLQEKKARWRPHGQKTRPEILSQDGPDLKDQGWMQDTTENGDRPQKSGKLSGYGHFGCRFARAHASFKVGTGGIIGCIPRHVNRKISPRKHAQEKRNGN
jgi:hypothetical protein